MRITYSFKDILSDNGSAGQNQNSDCGREKRFSGYKQSHKDSTTCKNFEAEHACLLTKPEYTLGILLCNRSVSARMSSFCFDRRAASSALRSFSCSTRSSMRTSLVRMSCFLKLTVSVSMRADELRVGGLTYISCISRKLLGSSKCRCSFASLSFASKDL